MGEILIGLTVKSVAQESFHGTFFAWHAAKNNNLNKFFQKYFALQQYMNEKKNIFTNLIRTNFKIAHNR